MPYQTRGRLGGHAVAKGDGILYGVKEIGSKDRLHKHPDGVRIGGDDFRIGCCEYNGDTVHLSKICCQ
ncbi:hypothetical protein Rhsp01_43550 [Rhizobium sp. NBRC 114257]|uniref:Uncharacterized protein n=1 Tax=Rhizobium dioscoreae TaxID=2653122 RepID=A0ABQ0Z9X2_9HYPH|nr:hypothetical protein RsS93_47160 [Rhizobium dioscoreae]GLU83179.1 hypothetical protein Rhsp01_43550 [Rhizobium sp. NBRC 114257]